MFLKLLEKLGRKKVVLDRGPSHPKYEEAKPWMNRYYVLMRHRPKWFPFNILIHEMLADDHGEGVHNHTFPYITIILRDGYWETLKNGKFWRPAGYIGFRSANNLHRVDLKPGTKPLTLFISGPFGLRKGPRSEYGIDFKTKKMNLKKLFINLCEDQQYEINQNQLDIINYLRIYYSENFTQSFFSKFLNKKKNKLGFYLVGDVGVGKTMILNFFFNELEEKKLRLHFNEFMIRFHDFVFQNKDKENAIELFVKNLEKDAQIIYFDEFQVTNIVDAMILGKLFKIIFEEKIKVIFSSNIKINDLYKDGLQRDQFIPFIKILENNSYEKELSIKEDYRSSNNISLERFLYPTDKSSNFRFNKFFRKITKNRKKTLKTLEIKGRKIVLENFYDGVAKFEFEELCNKNLGSEDYIKIAESCEFIFIKNLPDFNDDNSNQQQRFITLIDIIYEKKIPLMITSQVDLNLIKSSKTIAEPFKRTVSRLYELTSINYI
ncbi:MAG: cell division protein ZapE [Candidatus Pelagibacter sp.]